jgi:hypothetical protein
MRLPEKAYNIASRYVGGGFGYYPDPPSKKRKNLVVPE